MMLTTPGGSPVSAQISANTAAEPGVCSDGLTTTVLPETRAGASFQVMSRNGRFHGTITPTTPSGLRTV